MDISLLMKASIVTIALGLGLGIKYLTKSKVEVEIVEKIAEEVVDKETGIDIDFDTDTVKSLNK